MMRKLLTLWIALAAIVGISASLLIALGVAVVKAMPANQQIIMFGGQSSANNPPAPTGFLLMVDGVSFILRADGVSKICLAGGCGGGGGGTTATFNPAFIGSNITLSNGNLTETHSGTSFSSVGSTVSKSSGKFYFEVTLGSAFASNNTWVIGFGNSSLNLASYLGTNDNNSVGVFSNGNESLNNAFAHFLTGSWALGNVICVAIDLTAQTIWMRVNGGNWNLSGTADPATGVGGVSFAGINAGPYFPAISSSDNGSIATANFGATAYAQTAPSGFGNWQ